MNRNILIFIIGTLLFSCSQKTTQVVENKKKIVFPNEVVEEGFNLHAQNCARCHNLKVVNHYTREQWDKILPNMAKKAKISSEQQSAINEYINWELSK